MKIRIPFNKWSRERLKEGKKTATSRTRRYGVVGDVFTVDGITYQLEVIANVTLQTVCDVAYDIEGAKSKEEFIKIWEEIHPRKGWVPDQHVWFHRFKPIEGENE